jgi:DNA-binding response OmpR family regulator
MTIKLSIYDDNTELLSILATHFSKDKRFEVSTLSNVIDTIIIDTKKNKPNLILLDVSVAKDNLFTILNDLKNSFKDIFLVIFTGYNDESLKNKCLSSGADYVFDKGIPIHNLLDEIEKVCQK